MQDQITPLILDQGAWATYSCNARIVGRYLVAAVGSGLGIFFMWTFFHFAFRPEIMRLYPKLNVGSRRSWKNFMIFLVLSFSAQIAMERTRTLLVASESSIVETGCELRQAFAETYDRQKLEITYHFATGKDPYHELRFTQSGKRQITVELDGSSDLENLVLIAPDAMKEYVEQLRAESKRVPEELANL